MKKRTTVIMTSAVGAALAIGVAGVATAAVVGDDHEQPITGEALVRASAVALAHTGEGRVTDTEVGDEESYYEVEITLDDGRQIDVQLDENFQVAGSADDAEDEPGDD